MYINSDKDKKKEEKKKDDKPKEDGKGPLYQ